MIIVLGMMIDDNTFICSDTDVAPLWDPERRQFVGLMTVGDYIQALRVWRYTHTYIHTYIHTHQTYDMLAKNAD